MAEEHRKSIADRVEQSIESRTDEGEIERAAAKPADRASLRRTAIWLAVTGISLYLVAPSLIEVFGSWRQLSEIDPLWFPVMLALLLASLTCLWWLQKLALPSAPISGVVDSQLAGNALAKIAPGGGAVGAALQYRMLVERGVAKGRAVSGITAVNLLTFGIVLGLPVLALPALLAGGTDDGLQKGGLTSLAIFALLAATVALLLVRESLLRRVGRAVQWARNGLRRHSAPSRGLPDRLVKERDRLLSVLGPNVWRALVASIGRWAFDFAILLTALAAVGSYPAPGLVLLAFCASQVLAQIPVTPGGLGFVEAGLTASLALAGVEASDAILATFAYRLVTYWLPLPLGVLGLALHRRHRPATESAS
jgi:uncharacterized protein (TIRG00374 family)